MNKNQLLINFLMTKGTPSFMYIIFISENETEFQEFLLTSTTGFMIRLFEVFI
jgi:hypothetical protein